MDIADIAAKLGRLNPRIAATAERLAAAVPAARSRLDREYDRMLADLEPAVKPYRGQAASFPRLPMRGVPRDEVLRQVNDLAARERPRWRDGLASGAVYNGDDDHIAFLNRVYAITSQANPLHADLWPSATKYEAEIVAMTAAMLGGDAAPPPGSAPASPPPPLAPSKASAAPLPASPLVSPQKTQLSLARCITGR